MWFPFTFSHIEVVDIWDLHIIYLFIYFDQAKMRFILTSK